MPKLPPSAHRQCHDCLAVEPIDCEQLEEISLMTELMIAAHQAVGRLHPAAIDDILGIPESRRRPAVDDRVTSPTGQPQVQSHSSTTPDDDFVLRREARARPDRADAS